MDSSVPDVVRPPDGHVGPTDEFAQSDASEHEPAPAAMLAVGVGALALNQLVISLAWNAFPAAVVILLGAVLGVWLPVWAWCAVLGRSWRSTVRLGWPGARQALWVAGFGITSIAPVYAFSVLWQRWVPPSDSALELYRALLPRGRTDWISGGLAVVVAGPLCEEVLFRGLILPALARWIPAGLAVVLTAIAFGAAHGSAWLFAPIALLGLGLGTVAWWNRSTTASWITHGLFNAAAYVDLCMTHDVHGATLERWSTRPAILVVSMVGLTFCAWHMRQHRPAGGAPRAQSPLLHERDHL
jgi:membrane protease YdiL (CAAX protease family)